MAIGGDYSSPEYVNGYACWNCAQVAEAKKDINPADPQAGPGGADASTTSGTSSSSQSSAVIFGGALAGANPSGSSPPVFGQSGASPPGYGAYAPGARVNLSV